MKIDESLFYYSLHVMCGIMIIPATYMSKEYIAFTVFSLVVLSFAFAAMTVPL